MTKTPDVPGAKEVISWFGDWPSFHDAEILELHLDRTGQSWIKIHTWNMTDQIDSSGYGISDKHAVVTFILEAITGVELTGFSRQNVIAGLDLEQEGNGFVLTLSPCYGLAGSLHAEKINVSVAPGKPTHQ